MRFKEDGALRLEHSERCPQGITDDEMTTFLNGLGRIVPQHAPQWID